MRTEKRIFFIAFFIALLLMLSIFFAYAWYAQKTDKARKIPVAVCGKK